MAIVKSALHHLRPYLPTRQDSLVLVGLLFVSAIVIVNAVYQARYNIGSDGMAYISIAEHYMRGDLKTAINGYWSPALSWLLTPLISLGVEARLAFMIVNGMAAFMTIGVGLVIVCRYTKSLLASSLLIVCMTLFAHNAIGSFFPDMLLLAWVAFYTLSILYVDALLGKGSAKSDYMGGIWVGLLGAIGYFTKLFALPVFIVTTTAWLLLRLLVRWKNSQKGRRKIVLHDLHFSLVVAATFIIVSLPWVVMLSLKYNQPTIGLSLAVNTASIVTTSYANDAKTTPVGGRNVAQTIAKPPYKTALHSHEDRDPSDNGWQTKKEQTSTKEIVNNIIQRRRVGILRYIKKLFAMWPFILISPAIVLCWILIKRPAYKQAKQYYITILSFMVYFTGFTAIVGNRGGNARYFWPLLFLSVLLTCFIVGERRIAALRYGRVFSMAVAVLAVYTMTSSYPINTNTLFKPVKPSRLETFAYEFQAKHGIRRYDDFVGNNGAESRRFAFYIRGQAHGKQAANHQFIDIGMLREMEKGDIDYFLHFSKNDTIEFDPAGYGGEIVDRYYLGDTYPRCQNKRIRTYNGPCTLYVIKPQYD